MEKLNNPLIHIKVKLLLYPLIFNTINKNPYGLEHVTRLSGYAEPDLGYTNLRDYGNRITIISNIGTVDGGNEFTTLDSITRE